MKLKIYVGRFVLSYKKKMGLSVPVIMLIIIGVIIVVWLSLFWWWRESKNDEFRKSAFPLMYEKTAKISIARLKLIRSKQDVNSKDYPTIIKYLDKAINDLNKALTDPTAYKVTIDRLEEYASNLPYQERGITSKEWMSDVYDAYYKGELN
jgi:hypothetical protein